MRVRVAVGALAAVLVCGCGSSAKHLPAACSEGPGAIVKALAAAPGDVRLDDGSRLSDCVARAYTDGEVQQLGFTFTPVADRLAARHTPAAALQLGYLVGAVRRGAAGTNGVQVELVRRMESTITFRSPALLAAERQGARIGEARG